MNEHTNTHTHPHTHTHILPQNPMISSQVTAQYDKYEETGCNEKHWEELIGNVMCVCVCVCVYLRKRNRRKTEGERNYWMRKSPRNTSDGLRLMTFFFPHLLPMCSHHLCNSPELIWMTLREGKEHFWDPWLPIISPFGHGYLRSSGGEKEQAGEIWIFGYSASLFPSPSKLNSNQFLIP